MDVSFLAKDPSEGAKLLFTQNSNLTNKDLWNLFDFLLWEYQQDVNKLFEWYREIMSAGQGFKNAFITGHKFVCAKTIKEGDPIYRCKTCQMDGTNLLCVECFKCSDHENHDWTPTFTPGSGCCDCGDPESWDPKGFCSHHPGPNAGENIKITENLERVSRLLCGYIIYILSHSLSPDHSDVLYIEKKAASKSNYQSSANKAKLESDNNMSSSLVSSNGNNTSSKPAKKQQGGGMFGGLFQFGADNDSDDEDDDDTQNDNDTTMKDNEANQGIIDRYNTFIQLLKTAETDCDKNEAILCVSSMQYKPDGSDYDEPGESENCALGWEHPKDVCLGSIQCNILDAMEVVWKLRMYNKCLIASGKDKYLQFIAKKWNSWSYVNPEKPPYSTEIIKPKTFTRIITSNILLKIIKELRDWSSDSEILKRVIASCLMLNIDYLGPNCKGLLPIGKLSVIIPPFNKDQESKEKDNDGDNDNDTEMKTDNDDNKQSEQTQDEDPIVTAKQTAIYHLILNDHVLEQLSHSYRFIYHPQKKTQHVYHVHDREYNEPLIKLWFALVVIPSFKERVTQVFTACYGRMMQFWDFVNRQTQHCFVPLSVQFFTKKTTANVCESHQLIETLFDNHLLVSSPKFVAAYRTYCDNENIEQETSGLMSNDMITKIFDSSSQKANWTQQWMLSKKSTHCLYDIRYLLSIKDFMEYICFESKYNPLDHFWKRLLNLLSTYQHSKYQHRQSGREHIEMEDQTMVNVLRLDSTINGTNHRYLLNGLNALFSKLKTESKSTKMETDTDNDNEKNITTKQEDGKIKKGLDMLLDAINYGLSLINKKPYDNYDLYKRELKVQDENKMDVDPENDDKVVRMKLSNLDGGYLECPYFRADRDDYTLTLNLSKCLCNIGQVWCDVSGGTFNDLINELKNKYGDTIDDDNIFYWMDFSLQFISAFNQFHSDLLRKNGGIFATMIYNMEKPNFFSLFFSHNFGHIANHATQIFTPSDFLTLLLHRHCIYHWFCDENQQKITLSLKNNNISQDKLNKLCDPLSTGWKQWEDKNRVMKMIRNCLNELLAIISEPAYNLFLNNEDENAKSVIRYELIQWLVFSKFSMSELESRVIAFGKIDRPDIRPILNDIADYEAPQAMNAGKFRLKPEYYPEFNPYYRKYGKFNEYFGTADEQSEAIGNYISTMKSKDTKKSKDLKIMFPNWPFTTKLSNVSQLNLLTAPFMGLIWNTILYHTYIDDKERVNLTNFQQILRLISIALQAIAENRFDLSDTQNVNNKKLINNFTQRFKFRLTNEWDYVEDSNVEEIKKKYANIAPIQSSTKKVNENQNDSNHNTNTKEDVEMKDKDKDEYSANARKKYAEIMGFEWDNDGNNDNDSNNDNGIGIGSNLWLLCKMLVESKPKDEDSDDEKDKLPKITHIGASQLLLIEKILITLYELKNPDLQTIFDGVQWTPPSKDTKKKKKGKKKKKKLTPEEKRKLKAQKAKEKMMKKMNKKKSKFAEGNKDKIKKDAMREQMEEKQQKESFGIGIKYQCIVCRSRDKQDSMSMMAFATKCSILDRCVNNQCQPFNPSENKNKSFDDIEFYNKGLKFTYCGHCVHKSCYDTYIKQIQSAHNGQQHYAGRGSINILKKEFCCPYCKTVSNILVPLQIVYRNDSLKIDNYSKVNKDQNENENESKTDLSVKQNTEKTSVIRRKLCDDYFKSIFCIWDRYAHSIKQHNEYINKIGSVYSTLAICNTLTYSINCEEMNFRNLPISSRKDRLSRILSNMNTFIAALWSLAQQDNLQIDEESNQMIESKTFQRDIIKKYSWDILERKILTNNKDNAVIEESKMKDDDETYCYDSFTLLSRGIICYPSTFTFENKNASNEADMLLKTMDIDMENSNVRMDVEDDENDTNLTETKTDETKENQNKSTDNTAAIDLYKLLLSCYMMQLTQLAISFCCNNNNTNDGSGDKDKDINNENLKTLIITMTKDGYSKENLIKFLTIRIIPFLRKSCILYNAFGCISNLNDLWSAITDDALFGEADALCDILSLPVIDDILDKISDNKYFNNYVDSINKSEIDYMINKYSKWDKCEPFSLIKLPQSYNDLFMEAAVAKCPRQDNFTPKYSAICLICGEYVCLSCCKFGLEQRGDVTRHCLECNNGFGVFLWLQKSKLIIIWNNLGVLFKSCYLDKYGEEDCGLIRGNRISLNNERYKQLQEIITTHKIPNKLVQLRKKNSDLLERQLAL